MLFPYHNVWYLLYCIFKKTLKWKKIPENTVKSSRRWGGRRTEAFGFENIFLKIFRILKILLETVQTRRRLESGFVTVLRWRIRRSGSESSIRSTMTRLNCICGKGNECLHIKWSKIHFRIHFYRIHFFHSQIVEWLLYAFLPELALSWAALFWVSISCFVPAHGERQTRP